MLAYRQGNWARAGYEFGTFNSQDLFEGARRYFAALTFHQLGKKSEAHELFVEAERYVERIAPSYDAPPTGSRETPIIWCLLQPIRREATAVIEGSEAR